jgi:phospholipid/cholesterol/gamma-HCH transport system ATP-binding protein
VSGDAIIEVRGLCKAFGDKRLFDELSLSVRRGETLTIVGASGSGKSVLLKTLIGLVEADRGQVIIDGIDLVPLDEVARAPLRRRVSMLFQGGALFDSRSVADNVAYPLVQRRQLSAGEIAARVSDSLSVVGLPGIEAMMPSELSGGMKKRVALARAISAEPDVVLYDEPTTGLDPIATRRIDDLIRAVQRRLGLTSIVVTHDLASAFLVSDRIAMLDAGRIRVVEDVDGFRRSRDPVIRAFVDAMRPGVELEGR